MSRSKKKKLKGRKAEQREKYRQEKGKNDGTHKSGENRRQHKGV